MRRPQFSLKTMLWLIALAAAFLGGMAGQRKLDEPQRIPKPPLADIDGRLFYAETIRLPDGSEWQRIVPWDGQEPPTRQPVALGAD